uniref:Uncharacterized protein n=1 Tax=Arundo donax TaxID=35708 RepID=A0A0A9CX81_ARUDO
MSHKFIQLGPLVSNVLVAYIKTFVSRGGIMQCFDTNICYISTADTLRDSVPLVKDQCTLTTRFFL